MQSLLQASVLGVIQGITEFLPISSTAHLRVIPALLKWEDPGTTFSAVIQLGTMLAVVIYFWKDLIQIYSSLIKDLLYKRKLESYESKLAFWILLGTIPICVFGLLFKSQLEAGIVRNLNLISFYLIFFGILLYISEIFAKQKRVLTKINPLDVMLIGLCQSFALIPGVSRSGVTLFGGLLLGFKRSDAAKFSFLLSVPAVLLSGVLEFITLLSSIRTGTEDVVWINLFFGIFFAGLSGFYAIDFLLKYLQTNKTHIFVLYRVLLGIAVIYLNYKGIIH